jgi:hypothetical protein
MSRKKLPNCVTLQHGASLGVLSPSRPLPERGPSPLTPDVRSDDDEGMRTTTALRRRHGFHVSPETRLGVWTVSLAGFAVVGFVTLITAAGLGADAGGWPDWVRIPVVTAVLGSGTASAVTGLVATVRQHERSWSVVCATAFGVLMAAVLLRELAEGFGWLGS